MVSTVTNNVNGSSYILSQQLINLINGNETDTSTNSNSSDDVVASLNNIFQQASTPPRFANPEKIDNIYDLKKALKSGQVKEIKVWDKYATPNRKNNKKHYVVKFKAENDKWGNFEIGDFVNLQSIEELQKISVDKGVKFKALESSPILDNISQALIQSSPGVAAVLLTIFSFFGYKVYKKTEFRKLVRKHLTTNSGEVPSKLLNLIKKKGLRDVLVGMPEQVYTKDTAMYEYMKKVLKAEDIDIACRAFSRICVGLPGTGKSELVDYTSRIMLDHFNGKNGRAKSAVLNVDEILEEQGTGFLGTMSRWVLGNKEMTRIVAQEAERQGINMIMIKSDDADTTSNSKYTRARTFFKDLYDEVKLKRASNSSFLRQNKGKVTTLRAVQVGIASNTIEKAKSLKDMAVEDRAGGSIDFFRVSPEQRHEQIKHFLADAYRLPKSSVPDSLVNLLVDLTNPSDLNEYTYTARNYQAGLIELIKTYVKPSKSHQENINKLNKLADILIRGTTPNPQNPLSSDETSIFNAIKSDIDANRKSVKIYKKELDLGFDFDID
ncbi:MAG: hypothetical protein QNJ31_07785 [Candidatus Caenarcaniphilales bacterium]|nr:hypothetical protein [Candidatus Caenarcaniphilales bacterium]